jgi:RHS repeat-associated protein
MTFVSSNRRIISARTPRLTSSAAAPVTRNLWPKVVGLFVCLAFHFAAMGMIRAQETCPPVPDGGGQSISAGITVASSGTPVADWMVVPAYTQLRIDSLATAYGTCRALGWECSSSPCHCAELATYNRTINHTNVWADIATTGGLNGTYTVGSVYGKNPDGTTAFFNELDSGASNSTGPVYFTVSYPGTYRFYIQGIINTTICNILPDATPTGVITVIVGEPLPLNSGVPKDCQEHVGEPINVTNGNMYLQQTDYKLPGVGDDLQISRTYNSLGQSQRAGLFGNGWSSAYDESVAPYGAKLLRLNLADGRAVYLTRESDTAPYLPRKPLDYPGSITRNGDGSYTLSLRNGNTHQFNALGKLASLIDHNNNQTILTYNTSGRLLTITDPAGRTLTPAYTTDGMVSSISDSTGVVAAYTYDYVYSTQFYDWVYRLRTVTYPDGSQFKFSYDYPNRLTTVQDALDNVLETHTYDSQGRALTSERASSVEHYTLNYVNSTETDATDALGHLTKYFYDTSKGRNVVTRVEGSCECGNSQTNTWTYDSQLNLTAQTNALGQATSYTYDSNGNQLTVTNSAGTIHYTYNQLGEVLTVTDPMNGVMTNTYDTHGNILSRTDALNRITSYAYDARGQLVSVTDPRNNVTTLTYDTNGNLTRITDAFNNQTNFAYDARGRLTGMIDALANTTNYAYDAAGRVRTVTEPGSAVTTFTYDLAGRRTSITDARNNNTNYAYDAAYRLTSETNAGNNTTSYSYDAMSHLTGMTDSMGRTTNYSYDEFNRLVKITYPEAATAAGRLEERFTYDAAGNLTQQTDQLGRMTSFSYDSANRLASVTDAAQKITRYEYNARSQMTAVIDALNQRYEFTYDPSGRVTEARRGGLSMAFTYDAAGNRTGRTDYNGAITAYTYDALNRLTTVSYPNSTTATYGYDALSRLTSATNENGTVAIAYDNRNRMSSMTDVFNQTVSYAYDANSNRTTIGVNAVTSANYQYDALNRLTQLTDSAGAATTFGYDASDKLTSRSTPNGVTATYQYDNLNRLTRLRHIRGATTIGDYQYQYNSANNITQVAEPTGTHSYMYDVVNRLNSATHPTQSSESYTYDAVGNRTASHLSANYSYQLPNRLTAAASTNYSYDANGNLVSKTDASGVWQYSWNYENRLKQVVRPDGQTISYKYDALGRRIQRSVSGGAWTNFIYDQHDVIKDINSDGSTVDYLNAPGIDNKLRQVSSTGTFYFVQDHLGSTRALTDASGNVVEQNDYDSFGGGTGSARTRYGYTGREWDAESGLYYYRARWYDPQMGRFISEDPIGFGGGDVNLYAYVGNNPLRYNDPLGLFPDNPYDIIPQGGWDVIAGIGNLSAGFADNLTTIPFTNWSLTRQIRKWLGTDEFVDRCSKLYSLGGYAAGAWDIAFGWSLGARSMVKPGPYYEWSHWIPNRYRSVPQWIRDSRLNGNFTTAVDHALNDPFRYRFMPRVWKAANAINPAWLRQLNRIPNWLKGSAGGAAWWTVTKTSGDCECKE